MIFSPTTNLDDVDLSPVDEIGLEVCEDEFAALLDPFFSISPLASDVRFEANIFRLWQTCDCGFVEAWGNPFTRTRTPRAMQDSGHLIEVVRFVSGMEQGFNGDSVIDRSPGPIYVIGQAQPIRTVAGLNHVQKAFVPKSRLGLSQDLLKHDTAIYPNHLVGSMLHAAMDEVLAALRCKPDTVDTRAVERFLALLRIALGVPPEREDVRTQFREALFRRICGHIERHLSDPQLSTEQLLRNFGVSRASLYRMFERYNGVRNYIVSRRTVRAVLDMEAHQGERGAIRDAAERWGFSSHSNFNRTIRKVFDSSPSGLFQDTLTPVSSYTHSARILADLAARTAIAA